MTISRHHIGRSQVKEEHIPSGEIPLSDIKGNPRIGKVTINLPSIGADASGSATGTITGAKTTDIILVTPPTDLANLVFVGAKITDVDTVTVTAYNPTGAAIDKGPLDFAYLLYSP